MSLFYKYADSAVKIDETADADNLNLTAKAESIASDLPTESTATRH